MAFDIPMIGNVDVGSILINYSLPMLAVIVAVIIIILAYVILNLKKKGLVLTNYPVKVRIWEQHAQGFALTKHEKARSFQDEGKWYYMLKSTQTILQPIPFEFINADNSLDLVALNRDEFHPFKLLAKTSTIRKTDGSETIIDVPELHPVIDETFKHVWTERTKKNFEKKYENDNMIDKYLPIVAPVLVTILTVVLLYVALHEIQPVFQAAATLGTAMAKYAGNCTSAVVASGVAP